MDYNLTAPYSPHLPATDDRMFRHIARTDDFRWLGESLAGGLVFEDGIGHGCDKGLAHLPSRSYWKSR